MPVPTHFRFTVRGKFSNTPEQWSFGFHFGRQEPAHGDLGLGDINQGTFDTALANLMNSGAIDSGCEVVDWRAYVIGTDGKMEGNAPLLRTYTAAELDGSGTITYPPQVALCCTFVAENRGPARLGRMYLPGPAWGLGADRRLSIVNATITAQAVSAFLKGVSDSIDAPGWTNSAEGVNVSSRGGGGGTIQTIHHVEVGRVLDTMRSRRAQLLEDRIVDTEIDW